MLVLRGADQRSTKKPTEPLMRIGVLSDVGSTISKMALTKIPQLFCFEFAARYAALPDDRP